MAALRALLAVLCAPAALARLHPVFDNGTIPPPPWPPSWRMNDSTAVFFAGNDTGANSPLETLAEARFALVGLGWQLAMQAANHSHLETLESQAAAAIKAVNPATRVLVTRENEVALADWDEQRAVMGPEQVAADWWIRRDDGKLANESWYAPGGPLPLGKLWYNLSTPEMAAWFKQTWIARPLLDANIDGVYYDCSCSAPRGLSNYSREASDGQRVFDEAVNETLASSKAFMTWFPTHSNPARGGSSGDCATEMRAAIAFGSDPTRGVMLFALNDAELHSDDIVTPLSAFLIARGSYAYLSFPTYVYDIVSDLPWHSELELDFGDPLGAAVEEAPGVFARPFLRASALFNCSSLSGAITLL
jgi:hypothetical protein